MEEAGRVKGKVAIVTGAARGIGREACLALAREGAIVVGIDIAAPVFPKSGVKASTPEDLKETERLVKECSGSFLGLIADQRDIEALKKIAKQVEEKFGGIDILFANAGIQGFKPLLEMENDDWHVQIDVNLNGSANAIRAFAPSIVKRGGGSIILTSSTQGKHGTRFGAAYSASKWGIIGLMKSAALELGVYGIRVNAVVPGLIDTPLTRHEERYAQILQDAGRKPTGKDEEEAKKILSAKSPLGVPWLSPREIAPLVVFLSSEKAKLISGATFDVTAGDSAHMN